MKRWALGLGGVVLLGTLGACSSEDGQRPHTTTLTLTSDGATGDLRLQIVPLHPSYTASYPNPQAVSKMVVTVDGQGLFNAICTTQTGDNVDCEDHPFFSAVTRTQDGTSSNVHIYDLFGAEIASDDYPNDDTGTSDGVSGDNGGSGSGAGTAGGTADGSGSGGTGSGSGSGSGTGSGTTTTNTGGTSDSTGGTTVIVGGTTTVTKGGTVINTGGAVTIHGGTTTETGGTTTATQDGVTTTTTGGTTTVVGGTTTETGGVVTVTNGTSTTTGGTTTTNPTNGSTVTVNGTTTVTGGTTDNRGGTTATSGGTLSPVGASGSGSGTSGGSTGGSGSGSTSGGSTSGGSGSGSGSSCGSGGAGSGSGSGHTCDTSHEKAARDAFCAKINALLAQNNFTSRLDCSKLDDVNYVQATLPAHRTGGRCQDFWGPAQQEVHAHYNECYGDTNQWIQRSRWELIHDGVCRASPLVLDLDGDGVHLTGLDKGVRFDLFADGDVVKTGWVDGNDGLLALDRNGNGTIDSAAELFGTASGGEKLSDGFAALAEIDANGDGVVDARDPAFGELRVWRDANHDGVSQPAELLTLREAGVKRLLVDAANKTTNGGVSSVDANGNDVPLVGGFVRTDGSTGQMVDAFFRFTF